MSNWKLPAVLLPDGDERDVWVEGGRFTSAPVAGAETLPGRFALPGLVDAHAHLGLGNRVNASDDRQPSDPGVVVANLTAWRQQGVLLIRDVGAPASVTLDVRPDSTLPTLLAAGRWHAPEGRFFPAYHDPVPADRLVESASAEIARGARWIKIIADWTTPELSYDLATIRELVDAVHAAGARVAAHTQWEGVADLVAAGVDSVEHGCRLDGTTLAAMAERGTAWTPTLMAFNGPLPDDASPERRKRAADIHDNYRAMIPVAHQLGVTILAGTDTAGTVADEVRQLIDFGLTPIEALRSGTTAARAFLGAPSIEDAAPADVITFDADPRDDPDVLRTPSSIVLRGVRVT
jgi:imidazolonepropionase-like amidohydrolase